MAKFSANPLNWFRKKSRAQASPSNSPSTIKPPAKPRKSGDIFMHLINIQKSLKSIELAMRQRMDFTWLVQEATGQISLLKLEAETMREEEWAAVACQVEEYFETVSEGRLDLDEEGLAVILDFVNLYKRALGDTVSDANTVSREQMEKWTSRYQALMARMRPSYEETSGSKPEQPDEPASAIEDKLAEPALADIEMAEPAGGEESPQESLQESLDDFAEAAPQYTERAEAVDAFESPPEFADASLEPDADIEAEMESVDSMEEPESPPAEDEIPLYDPAEQMQVRDVVISDAEIKTAREYMELGKSRPAIKESEKQSEPFETGSILQDRNESVFARRRETADKSPVELQEVERLKAKLAELHEKQEMLSTKMSSILGDYKKAVERETVGRETRSVEDLDMEDLEDIIFIGREKG